MATENRQDTYQRFQQAVKMTRSEMTRWLKTDESKQGGEKSGAGESIGEGARVRKITGRIARNLRTS